MAASPAPIPATSHAVARSGFLAGVVVAERLVARPQLPGPGGTGVCGQCRQTVRLSGDVARLLGSDHVALCVECASAHSRRR
ncbi:MAG TPA: hypothetical protein VFE55_23095 [Acidimicrobiia bacterium]|nr:hypothetical protein [Acidimicrobiia bacterium]